MPTSVEPVNDTLRTRASPNSSRETMPDERDVSRLTTPFGTPASSIARSTAAAVSGVAEAGLTMLVQPAAIAGPSLRVIIAAGKFHGVIAATTPTPWRSTRTRLAGFCGGTICPYARSASPPNHSMKLAAYSTSPLASASGLPCSSVISVPISSIRSRITSADFRSSRARVWALVFRQPSSAAAAALIAARTSSAVRRARSRRPRRSPDS